MAKMFQCHSLAFSKASIKASSKICHVYPGSVDDLSHIFFTGRKLGVVQTNDL